MRRFAQIGAISRGTPARLAGALVLVGMGAAWAFSPSSTSSGFEVNGKPVVSTIIEGDAQAVCELGSALWGSELMSLKDKKSLALAATRRVVLESKVDHFNEMKARRARIEFARIVEDVEEHYVDTGSYPAIPTSAGRDVAVSYQVEADNFKLASGGLYYDASAGVSQLPITDKTFPFAFKGYLDSEEVGFGPWKASKRIFRAASGAGGQEEFEILESLPEASPSSARMFFPTNRASCGYLFCRRDGDSAYSSGELSYDRVSGVFTLKLFRLNEAASGSFSAEGLETELACYDGATTLVGDAGLLYDLGFVSKKSETGKAVALSSSAILSCSTTTALDGLRFSALEGHLEEVSGGQLIQTGEEQTGVAVVGRICLKDQQGQLRSLRLRAGRGATYDWVVGQLCSLDQSSSSLLVDSVAYSYESQRASGQQPVKAGR